MFGLIIHVRYWAVLVQGQSWRNSKSRKNFRERLSVVSIWSYKREFMISEIKWGANQRLFPVTELYLNKMYEVGEKHLAVYDVRLLSRENLTYKQKRKTVKK